VCNEFKDTRQASIVLFKVDNLIVHVFLYNFFIQAVSVNCMSSDKLMISCVLYKSVQGELPPLLDKTCTYKRHQTVAGLNTF
jgi:hypothetical protein